MLPQFYRFVVVNNSGSLLSFDANGRINLKQTAWHMNVSTGKIVYTPLADDDLGFVGSGTLANGAEIVGDVQIDNTSNLFLGAQIQLEITHDEGAAADGTFDVYISGGDATGELPTDADGYGSAEAARLEKIDSLTWDPDGSDDEVMRSNPWNI